MKRERKSRLYNEHGFTLIESTLVVIVIGLLAIVAIPKLVPTDKHEVYITAHQITADMRYARGLAIANAENHKVKFYPDGSVYTSYAIRDSEGATVKSMDIPEQVDCTIDEIVVDGEISFTSLGSASPGGDDIISLQVGSHTNTISVVAATGRISSD